MEQRRELSALALVILLPFALFTTEVGAQPAQSGAAPAAVEPADGAMDQAQRGHMRKVTTACFGPGGDPLSPCDVEFKTQNAGYTARCVTASSGICQVFLRCCGPQGSPPQLLWNVKATSAYGQASTSFWTSCGWTCDEHKYLRFTFSGDRNDANHRIEQSNVDPLKLDEWEDSDDAVVLTPEEAAMDAADCKEGDTRAQCRCRYKCVCVRHSGGRCEQVDVAWNSDCDTVNGKCTGKCRQYRTFKPCKPSQCDGGIPNCVRRHSSCKKF